MSSALKEKIGFDQDAMAMTFPEKERLGILVDKLGEALHMAGEILRHGYGTDSPERRVQLAESIGEVLFAINFLCAYDVDDRIVGDACRNVERDIEESLHFHKNPFHHVLEGRE